ncbi:MAG: nucleotidyltransferase domain-containing protein [Chloroflexota bacterium]|nr:nucleotidyltransferase domain-containing protein [Chloroflexota bacterium]
MSTQQTLEARGREQRELLARAVRLLQDDPRVVAAWLAGSLGRGTGDALSDIDLWVILDDKEAPAINEGRRAYASRLGRPMLISEAPQNAPPGGAYLWVVYPAETGGPQHVDWNFQPYSTAQLPPDVRLLFSRVNLPVASAPQPPASRELASSLTQEVSFFWAMCMVSAKYIARKGDPYNVLTVLNITGHPLQKTRRLLGHVAEGPDYRYLAWAPDAPPLSPLSQLAWLKSLCAEMQALHGAIEHAGGEVPREAIEPMYGFFELAEAMLLE